MITTLLIAASLLAASLPFFLRTVKALTAAMVGASTLILALALGTGVPALLGRAASNAAGFWYVDAFAGLLVVLIGVMQWTAMLTSLTYLRQEEREGAISLTDGRRYYALLALFIFAMFAAVTADSLGVLWIALEATTLATTFLVAFYARPSSLEAAWKYLILCSVGIALGLVSVLVVYAAATGSGAAEGFDALRLSVLLGAAATLPPALVKIAFAFALVGYGTKVGIVPLHMWLPDAHSSAPAPISALLSGVLLNAAFLALMRFKALTDGALGTSGFTDGLLLWVGVLTIVVASLFILAQTDYKRLLAYSSVEHMGFVVFTSALGALGAVAAVIEIVGHALAKSMLFFGAGNILLRFHSTKFGKVAGVYRALPYTGGLFFAGILFLLAAPPSPLFMSEYLGIAAGIGAHPYAVGLVLLALAVALAGFIRLIVPMLFSRSPEPVEEGETFSATALAMAIHVVLLVGFFGALMSGAAMPIIARIASLIA